MEWCKYPNDEEIKKVGLRGIFIGNYDPWDAINTLNCYK